MDLKTYTTSKGEELLYSGKPEISMLENLASGCGDCWHSSFEQGFKNAFSNIQYQTHTAWWYTNDFDNLNECISWRINPYQFVIRKTIWELYKGFDNAYQSNEMKALSLGYDLIRNGGVPLYVKGLYTDTKISCNPIPVIDEYLFFRKKFKSGHSLYMLFRKGIWNWKDIQAFFYAKRNATFDRNTPVIAPKMLKPIEGKPTVSYIIPTMMRQDYTLQLLDDLNNQTYKPSQVVVIDATPPDQRDESLYNTSHYPFDLVVKWQTSKGSCRARNEGIEYCSGDFIVFGDDDIRLAPDYIENHIRLLQTYNAGACNGLDIRAENHLQNLDDLAQKRLTHPILKVGVTAGFNNANSCVKREHVTKLTGNDVNYDGGYGEDSDFGLSLVKSGVVVLYNPFSVNLHLKPASGGYRWWGAQAKLLGKKRKQQPWELDTPVKWIRPVPSPTIMYYIHKHFPPQQIAEYKIKYFMYYLGRGSKLRLPLRILNIPYKLLQYSKSVWYAKKLVALGIRYK
ncbi:family 2 glycosyl transferase [Bacteroidetes bacterium UKL13-3]|nr:family 2 glycosyl transferase [Bacteroidetes bacterium UKL13-3]HCP94720.1 family 2 glycosyl transferase [Bacteroidota bacterium]